MPTDQGGGGYTSNANLLLNLQRLAWSGLRFEQGSNPPEPTPEWQNLINNPNNTNEALEIDLIIKAEYAPDDIFYYDWNENQYNLESIRKGVGC